MHVAWDIKLDIPETAVSLTGLDDFLREKLGHDTHITGVVVRKAWGLGLTARVNASGAGQVCGPDGGGSEEGH